MRLYCWELLCSTQPKPNINKLIEKHFISDVFERLFFFFFSKKVTFKMYSILITLRKPTWRWGEWEYLSRDELWLYWCNNLRLTASKKWAISMILEPLGKGFSVYFTICILLSVWFFQLAHAYLCRTTNLDGIFKSRDIALPTKVRLVKAMVFPVVMYGCES